MPRGIQENTNPVDEFILLPSPQALSLTLNPGKHRTRVPSIILTKDSFFSNCVWLCALRFYARTHGGALRCRHATIRGFLIKQPGLVLNKRTPAARLSSAASVERVGVTTCELVLPPRRAAFSA